MWPGFSKRLARVRLRRCSQILPRVTAEKISVRGGRSWTCSLSSCLQGSCYRPQSARVGLKLEYTTKFQQAFGRHVIKVLLVYVLYNCSCQQRNSKSMNRSTRLWRRRRCSTKTLLKCTRFVRTFLVIETLQFSQKLYSHYVLNITGDNDVMTAWE